MVKRIKHDCLLPWFLEDHEHLPEEYLKACRKFFDKLQAPSYKRQATSGKRQAFATIEKYNKK